MNWVKKMASPNFVDVPEGSEGHSGLVSIEKKISPETVENLRSRFPDMGYIGSGARGTAISLGDGKVGKITRDVMEVDNADDLLEAGGNVPGFIRVYSTEALEPGLWMITMDRAHPLDPVEGAILSDIWTNEIALDSPFDLMGIYNLYRNKGVGLGYIRGLHREFLELVKKIKAAGKNPKDAHGGNLGRDHNNELVLFDLGDIHR